MFFDTRISVYYIKKSCTWSVRLHGASPHRLKISNETLLLLLWSVLIKTCLLAQTFLLQLYEGSTLHSNYKQHLSSAGGSYRKLIADLKTKFGHGPSGISTQQGGWT